MLKFNPLSLALLPFEFAGFALPGWLVCYRAGWCAARLLRCLPVASQVKIRQSRLMVKNLSTGGTFLNGLRITEATLEAR